jgi:hypothetical protein
LRTQHEAGLRAFARRVSAGEPEDAAFAEAFPDITPSGLEDAVAELRSHPRSQPLSIALRPYTNAFRIESMTATEVRHRWDFLKSATARLR